ncbi:unnamed protein product [Blepharisma stoltei]|uniref:Uncharacterized protein n=1 Tax=Blepharisma stoltei TaxID=1481888 RepID=A0AAU9IW86_9CILI|nr:unnamed protein product [Blepharisma stoltei]
MAKHGNSSIDQLEYHKLIKSLLLCWLLTRNLLKTNWERKATWADWIDRDSSPIKVIHLKNDWIKAGSITALYWEGYALAALFD